MRRASSDDLSAIFRCLRERISECVYIYIDIAKYGINQSFMRVWINEGPSVTTVVMKYYDSLQIYASGRADMEGIASIIIQENVRMISGEKTLVEQIVKDHRILEKYHVKSGHVFRFGRYREFLCDEIHEAKPDEAAEIARLICMDEEFAGNYQCDILAEQLSERMTSGFGRSLIIRKNNIIVAHIATYAEHAGIAVTSGLIVHPDYRKYSYGTVMESYLVNTLLKENYEVFTFIDNEKRRKLLQVLGAEHCSMYAKLIRNL